MARSITPSIARAPATPINVGLSISKDGQNKLPIEWFAPEWIMSQQGGAGGALYGGIVPQLVSGAAAQGIMLALQANLVTVPGSGAGSTALAIMLFDSAAGTAPLTGAVPIWSSVPLTVPYEWASWDDEFGPQIEWDQSLWVAASSTFDTWTACASGASFRLDLKQGS